jgi:hypothetical protein
MINNNNDKFTILALFKIIITSETHPLTLQPSIYNLKLYTLHGVFNFEVNWSQF